jgi:hypothetical protein
VTINTTPNRGYPWPDNTEAVTNGWDAIRDLAVALDTDVAALPQGVLDYAEVTANQTGLTATDLTDLSVTVDVPAGRRIKVTLHAVLIVGTTGQYAEARVHEGATTHQAAPVSPPSNTVPATAHAEVILEPTAGAHTYKGHVAVSGGTASMQASAVQPAFILVEDLGAV